MAKYWVHNGYLMADGEKMSKSLGNFYTVHDLLEAFPGEAIRLVLLKTYYRKPLDFTEAAIDEATAELNSFYIALRDAADVEAAEADIPGPVLDALCDDLNTPLVISRLHELLGALNKAGNESEKARAKAALLAGGETLGLLQQDPGEWLKGRTTKMQLEATAKGEAQIKMQVIRGEEWINEKVNARNEARKNKDFATADRIRDELADARVILEDKPDGTTEWRRA